MKTLQNIIPEELTQAIGYTILHSLWQAILLSLVLTVCLFFLHWQTAIIRYRAALSTLLLQLVLSGVTFGYYYQSAVTAGKAVAGANFKASFLLEPGLNQTHGFFNWASISLFLQDQLPLIVAVWLLGIVFMLLRFLGSLAYLQRLRTYKNTPLPASWHQKLINLSQKLHIKTNVNAAESALVDMPLVIGFFKPIILLPLGTIGNLPVNQVEAILAHELAHIRRQDYLINMLQVITEALFFYHPAIWWLSDFVRVERENCCDDQAIAVCGDKMAYAQALTRLAETKVQAPGLTLALAGKDGSVLGRVKRLFQVPTAKPTVKEGFVAVALIVFSFTTISAVALSNYSTKQANSPNQAKQQVSAENPNFLKSNLTTTVNISDSTKQKKEAVLIKNNEGKLISLFIEGVKVPLDQLATKYKSFKFENDVEGITTSDGNTTIKGKIILNTTDKIIAPKAPPAEKILPPPPPPAPEAAPAVPPALPAEPAQVLINKMSKSTVVVGNATKSAGQAPVAAESNTSVNVNFRANAPEPLYILDGKVIDKAVMNQINPNSIQEINVLKGGSTVQYGEAGKNGVILITTKSGQAGSKLSESELIAESAVKAPQSPTNTLTIGTAGQNKLTAAESNDAEQAKLERDHNDKVNLVLRELKKDNLYSDEKDYTLKITNSGMFINNVQQPDALFQKYRKYLPYPNKNVTYQTFEINGRFREK